MGPVRPPSETPPNTVSKDENKGFPLLINSYPLKEVVCVALTFSDPLYPPLPRHPGTVSGCLSFPLCLEVLVTQNSGPRTPPEGSQGGEFPPHPQTATPPVHLCLEVPSTYRLLTPPEGYSTSTCPCVRSVSLGVLSDSGEENGRDTPPRVSTLLRHSSLPRHRKERTKRHLHRSQPGPDSGAVAGSSGPSGIGTS